MSSLIIVGVLLVFIGIAVVLTRINLRQARCPECGGVLIQGYIVCHERDDLLICDYCEKIFRQFDGGKLFEIFGNPTLKR